jgi:hypothetical protein
MKYLKILFLLPVILMITQQACDIVEEPYLVPVDTLTNGGNGETVRKILLEDYTGHKCPNCPEAAEEAHSLKLIYGEQLVLLTIHAGSFAEVDPSGDFTYDFKTPEGVEVHDYYGFFYYPAGLVNRTKYSGSLILSKDKWQNAVASLVDLPQQVNIKITKDYNSSTRKLDIAVETEFLEDLAGTYYICAYLTESEIVKPQQTEAGVVTDYVHNHILRTSLNGTWGDLVGNNGAGTSGEKFTNEYSIILDTEWVAENCGLVVFVYDNDSPTREVIQAEEALIQE